MARNYDLYGPGGQRAVIFSAATRQGTRIEIGLQVWNMKTLSWEKQLCTRLLPDDIVGICFELQRLCDKATAAGFSFCDQKKTSTTTPGTAAR